MNPGRVPEPRLALARPLTRRQLLAAGSFGALALFLGACGPAPAPSRRGSAGPLTTASPLPPPPSPSASPLPPLGEDQLTGALAALPGTGTLAVPGGGSLPVADLQAAAAALAAPDGAGPSVDLNPVAALGYILAAADWSGASGALDLSRLFPGLALPVIRLPLARLPDGGTTAMIADALPAGLTVRAGAALIVLSRLADGNTLVALDAPARPIDGHPRLELGVVPDGALTPLLAIAGARLDPGSGAVVLADGTAVALRPLTTSLAGRLSAAAGVLFVDRTPIQPKGAKTPVLTLDPVVPWPPADLSGIARVSQAKDGRVLALDAAGTAVGRAQYIGGTPVWDWRGKDGLALTLRELADVIGWRIGCEFTGSMYDAPAWLSLFGSQFNQTTIDWGVNWGSSEPSRGAFDFSILDRQLRYAARLDMRVRGQALVLPAELPVWVSDGRLSASALRSVLQTHVATLVGHGKGAVAEWTVVNEPFIDPYRPNDPFHAALGSGYVDLAFAAARQADPAAVLIYNDSDNHHAAGLTTALTVATVQRLHAKDLVDRVGLQMHLDAANPPAPADVIRTMRSYAVPVCVTEFDIDVSRLSATTAQRYAAQGRIAGSMLHAARESGVCKSFSVWGIGDGISDNWLQRPNAPAPMATPFDGSLHAKPFFDALLAGLA